MPANAYASAIAKDGAAQPLRLWRCCMTQTISRIMGMVVEDSGQQLRLVAHVMCKAKLSSPLRTTATTVRWTAMPPPSSPVGRIPARTVPQDGKLHQGLPDRCDQLDSDGYIVVDEAKCISCESVAICPTHVMQTIYEDSEYSIDCNSKLLGDRYASSAASVASAARSREQVPGSGCKAEDYLAHFDQAVEHANCEAAEACPTKIIRKR